MMALPMCFLDSRNVSTLGPGVIGHIARNEPLDPQTFVSTSLHQDYCWQAQRYFPYDRIEAEIRRIVDSIPYFEAR
jgi:hypothetical protein